jgi:transcriptional regulator with XRE-family HTH domain
MTEPCLGTVLKDARAAHDLSLQAVAERARCSAGYVHKLEMDRVRSPSPRVLAGLAEALGLAYGDLMQAAGYDQLEGSPPAPELPGAVRRYSNAHIVQLLEQVQDDIREMKSLLTSRR